MNTPNKAPAPFNADNITGKGIDLCHFICRESGEKLEAIWQAAQYGEMSPKDAADKVNEIWNRLQIAFTP